jgi:hypothetical protein
MLEIDKRKAARTLTITRFSQFVCTYLYDTDWVKVAQACGVIKFLEAPKHYRVTQAQRFGDDDYQSALTLFITDVFDADEHIGNFFVKNIIGDSTER